MVPDCSAEKCVSVLKRFFSSRGTPKLIVSNNGKQFISKEVQDFVATKYIRWSFNPEASPWTGGFFERMIKSVKRCLKKILRNAYLNYEELLTVIKEVENIINNRPLIYMYDDINEQVLTPNKLLFGRNLEVTASSDEVIVEKDLSKREHYVNRLIEDWWKKWRDDYLVELREYQKHKIRKTSLYPHEGDIVLIADDNLKRNKWRMGKIIKLMSGKDGK